jgi:peptidoglycan/xylan/chitin deacetylase (PgdA/CDA1 family)
MMKNMRNKKYPLILGLLILLIILIPGIFTAKKFSTDKSKSINSLMLLIETKEIEGILQWEKELDQRGLATLINVKQDVLERNPETFKRLASKGYEVAGQIDGPPFWDMPYEEQYEYIKKVKEVTEAITGKKMRVVNSGYFAYDENTLKASDALGIEYVLGRGVRDIEAVIFKPEEYQVKVISVSNVDIGEPMGRGSLCDYSLWARGATPLEFGQMIDESIAKEPTNMILVSHANIGGTRAEWWHEYAKVLANDKISWKSFDEWISDQGLEVLPNREIPINKEVKYGVPTPAKAIEDYEPVSGIENIPSFSDDEIMCR